MESEIARVEPETHLSKPLQVDESPLSIVRAPNVGSVLPIQFYDGAAELFLDDSQIEMIRTFHDCADDEIDVRPDGEGLIYVRHGWYERRLTEIFGPGAWAMIPATNIQIERETSKIYCSWVLRVRGADGRTCFVGQAIGWAQWIENNPRANKADMFEITRSDAIVKICAKSSLMIGSNLWDRRFARSWVKKNCVKVNVKTFKGTEQWYRRKDEEQFENELSEIQKSVKGNVSPEVAATEVSKSGIIQDKKIPHVVSPDHPSRKIEPADPTPTPISQPQSKITDSQIRLFFVRARAKKLIVGEDAVEAANLVGSKLDRLAEHPEGKTTTEILVALLKSCSPAEFQDVLKTVEQSRK